MDVWRVLIDFNKYAEWNPFIIKASGKAMVGEQLQVTVRSGGKSKSMDFRPIVTVARTGRHLQWFGRFIVPKLFDGRHEFILESVDGNTLLHHHETFSGIVPSLFPRGLDLVESQFQEMNRALKARAEPEIGSRAIQAEATI